MVLVVLNKVLLLLLVYIDSIHRMCGYIAINVNLVENLVEKNVKI